MSVGSSVPHDAAFLHVTGGARYVDDMPTPRDCLHLAFGMSSIAAGSLDDLDLSAVRSSPGVKLALGAQDLASVPDCSPSPWPEPLMSDGTIHHAGQVLFLVAADSHHAARKAAAKAVVKTTPGVPILSIEEALEANSRFEDGPVIYTRGAPESALDTAKHQVSGRFELGGQEHFYLEGQAALAIPGEAGDMFVISSTQHPTEIQHKVADALGVPMHSVRVETRRMGGGFGGKESQGNALAISCALVAARTGKPVKMRYDRDDDFLITGKRHDFRIDYRIGFDGNGRIQGLDVTHFVRCGWSQDLSLPICDRAMLHADNAYWLPNVRITSHRLKTNTQSATAFRGFGGPQGMLGMEVMIERIARFLDRDPLDIRKANFYESGQKTPYLQTVENFVVPEMTEALVETSAYTQRRESVDAWNANHDTLKRGIALTPVKFGISFTLTHLNQAGALVHVYTDGSIHLNHGGTEMGQGLFQKVAQVAASRFGVPLETVKITATDTAKVPNTSATAASSGSDLNGMAVKAACDTIRDRIAEFLAEQYQTTPQAIRFEDGWVHVGTERLSFADAVQKVYLARISLSATGYYRTPKIAWDRIKGEGRPFFYYAQGVSCSEVVIDTLTGENRILRTDILHDTGSSLNPALDIGQIEGGYVQGAGWLTTEELVWDDKGILRTHAPSTYKIPAASDRPEIFNVALWDRPNAEASIYRSKAVGEPPLMLGISAFLALADAVSSCGGSWHDLHAPATPEQVLAAVQRARAS